MACSSSSLEEAVRLEVYRHFIENGAAPTTAEVADALGSNATDVKRAYVGLAGARAITLNDTKDSVWMAHPFSAVATPYRVEAGGISYWANCAWDALGIAAVLRSDTAAVARCPDCDESVDLSVRNGRVADAPTVVHFAVPPLRFWESIGFT